MKSLRPHPGPALEDFIPYSSQPAPGIVIGRGGELYASWQLEGVPFEGEDDAELARGASELNLLYRSLPPGSAVTCHRIRRSFEDELRAPSEPGFARDFARSLAETTRSLMKTELFVTLQAPAPAAPGRALRLIPAPARAEALRARIEAFEELARGFERALSRFGPRRLSEYRRGGLLFSAQLELYNALLTLERQPVRIPPGPVYSALGNATLFAGSDLLEVESATGRRFACGLEIKDFCEASDPGLLDALLFPAAGPAGPEGGFIETQAFRILGRAEGERFLKTQQRRLIASSDAGVTQVSELSEAMDGLACGSFVMGEYGYGLLLLGESAEEARRAALDAAEKMKGEGLLPYRSTLALPGLYLAGLPGNFSLMPRAATLTSVNFAHLAPFHRLSSGKRDGNPWGEALMLLRTPSFEPFYFSFHASRADRSSLGDKSLGNTVVIGSSGSGKTVFLNACAALAQKYRNEKEPFSLVFFDKDRGAEAAVRALPESAYFSFTAGDPAGLNPFAMEPTEENLSFLFELVRQLLESEGGPLSPAEGALCSRSIRAVMALPSRCRRLAAVRQSLVSRSGSDEEGLALRLAPWIEGGEFAWVFDNERDTLDFTEHENIGIDGTAFLDRPKICGPIAFYLLYRMEQALDGRRFVFFMDEFWKWLRSESFSGFAVNKLKTVRKQNGLGVFATQSPADVLTSKAARDVIEQSATQVFLPNPRATEADYVEGFKVPRDQFEIIRGLAESSHQMLVRQDGRAALCSFDLSGLPEALFVLSGSTRGVKTLEGLIGRDPVAPVPAEKWLPEYLRAMKSQKEEEK